MNCIAGVVGMYSMFTWRYVRLTRSTLSHVTVNRPVCKRCIADCTWRGIHHEVVCGIVISGDWQSDESPGGIELMLNVLQYIIARVGAQRVRNVRVVNPEWLSRLETRARICSNVSCTGVQHHGWCTAVDGEHATTKRSINTDQGKSRRLC